MSNCKVSDAFVLPMTFDNSEDTIHDAEGDIIFNLGNFAVDGDLAVYAINEHDKLVEQVAHLTEQNNALIEYIKTLPSPVSEEVQRERDYWRGYAN